MARGIIIFGSAGSGKTTLGRMVAEQLSFPYFDIDDYIWRKDTPEPFTVMYSRAEKSGRLMADISQYEYFVKAGSMSSFHEGFDPLFDLAVHLSCDTDVRIERVNKRAVEQFGNRVLESGDLYKKHQKFLDNVARYDKDGSPNLAEHLRWVKSMACPVLQLDGEMQLAENCARIVNKYLNLMR